MAGAMGSRRAVQDRRRPGQREVLFSDDAALPVGRPAHRPLVRDDAQRRGRALSPHAGLQRLLPHRLRRLWPAGRERGHQEGRPSLQVDAGQHRPHARPTALHGRDVGLGSRGGELRPGVLQVDAVVLPEAVRHGPGLQGVRAGGLVPQLQHHPGARAGLGRRPPLRALRDAGDQERAEPVEVPHHPLRPGAAGRPGDHRLAGAGQDHADQLDRPLRGRRGHLHRRARLPARRSAGRGRSGGLHHPARHPVGRDLHGAGAGASAGQPHHHG